MESWLLPLLIALSLCTSSATDQPVNFSLIVSSAPTINTSGIVSAIDQVLERINSDTTILPGYCLQYTQVLDTQVSKSTSTLVAAVYYNVTVSSTSLGTYIPVRKLCMYLRHAV